MSFRIKDKFHTTAGHQDPEQLEGDLEGTSPALEEPAGPPQLEEPAGEPTAPAAPAEGEQHAAPAAPEFTEGGDQ